MTIKRPPGWAFAMAALLVVAIGLTALSMVSFYQRQNDAQLPKPSATAASVIQATELESAGWTQLVDNPKVQGNQARPSGKEVLLLLQAVYADETNQALPRSQQLAEAGKLIDGSRFQSVWRAAELQAWKPPNQDLGDITFYTNNGKLALLVLSPSETGSRMLYMVPVAFTMKHLQDPQLPEKLAYTARELPLFKQLDVYSTGMGLRLTALSGYPIQLVGVEQPAPTRQPA